MRTIKITIEYDGARYSGWQRQPNGLSIQEVLEGAIAQMTGATVGLTGSGRTDAGVHALNQVAHFTTLSSIPEDGFLRGLNSLIPGDIAVKSVMEMPEGFHARYGAMSKIYEYRIWNRAIRSPLQRQYTWHVPMQLDVAAMNTAARCFQGIHDFSSFCGSKSSVKTFMRKVIAAEVFERSEGLVVFSIEAEGFLRHMVRNIMGALVDVGLGRLDKNGIISILNAHDRRRAGVTAPPQGLFLLEVKYR
ncbi:MAG: tRNA pseudouridine(38-40) synthase TruA [Deltaproteobacteria bacterium]|nr:tRNA pseudouridine(38-40) synthase TruA [Deltaproteobacteria bacterium]